jgi:hypothetical protein
MRDKDAVCENCGGIFSVKEDVEFVWCKCCGHFLAITNRINK